MELTGRRRLIVLAVGLLLPLSACSESVSESPDTEAGDVVDARRTDIAKGESTTLLVPSGRLKVRLGAPVSHVDGDQASDLRAHAAPDGGSMVPIVWSFNDDVFGKIASIFGDRRPVEVDLVADGKKYSLTPPGSGAGRTAQYVAVAGPADDIDLEVTYDGLTQIFDGESGEREVGVARALYEIAETKLKARECPVNDWLDGSTALIQFECDYGTAVPSPYVANTWVKRGHTWLSVHVATHLANYALGQLNGAIANYEVKTSTELSNIDGLKPVGTLDEVVQEGAAAGTMVFDVKGALPEKLEVRRRYQLSLNGAIGDIEAPQRRTVEIGGELTLVY